MMNRKIAAQLYTLRDFCQTEADFNETLAKLQKIGYKAIQVSGVGPLSAKAIRSAADTYGMEIYCTHRGFNEFTDDIDKLIQFHHELNCPIAGLGCAPQEYFQDADSVSRLIEKFNAIAARLRENGLRFGYHNHAMEFAKIGGQWTMDRLLTETDPEALCFIPDVYWMAFAGVNPAEYLKKLGSRAGVVHFKDMKMKAWTEQTYCEVLCGNLDFDSIIAACDEGGAGCAAVEQDICEGDPFDSLAISYQNLAKKGFC